MDEVGKGSLVMKFHFDGDSIDVHVDGKNVFVSVKRICEALGIDPWNQIEKLSSREWATTVLSTAVAEDGKLRKLTMLHLDSLPMWLATIEPSRCSELARPKLLKYQLECARVLADHFLGSRSSDRSEALAVCRRAAHLRLTGIAYAVLLTHLAASEDNGSSPLTVSRIADLVGTDESTARRAEHRLVELGLVTRRTGRRARKLAIVSQPLIRDSATRLCAN